MTTRQSSEFDGVWILQDHAADAAGMILGVCESIQEVEKLAEQFAELFPDSAFAYFPLGHRFGASQHKT